MRAPEPNRVSFGRPEPNRVSFGRHWRGPSLAVAAALASVSCVRAPSAHLDAPTTTASGVAMTVPSPASVYPHCPPAAPGARTDVQDVAGGVVLDVTGNDVATSDDIRARGRALLDVVAAGKSEVRHTGDGDGPGLGRCPIVLHDARITATPIDRGVRFVVVTGPDEVS